LSEWPDLSNLFVMSATDRTIEVHGFALREIRELRGRTVADLADSLGVDRSYIRHLEVGTKRRVSPELYHALCAELLVRDARALLAVAPVRQHASA
jgi:transcriptional regulator with XRE-family HTH domain